MPVTIASGHKAGIQQPRFLLGRNDPLPAQQLLGGVLVRAAELGVVLSLFASEETEAWGGNVSAAAEEQCVRLQTDAIGNISPSDVALCFSGWTVRLFLALSFSLPFPAADCGTLKRKQPSFQPVLFGPEMSLFWQQHSLGKVVTSPAVVTGLGSTPVALLGLGSWLGILVPNSAASSFISGAPFSAWPSSCFWG